jgi:hypothetical protein
LIRHREAHALGCESIFEDTTFQFLDLRFVQTSRTYAVTVIRPAFRERGFGRITISTS